MSIYVNQPINVLFSIQSDNNNICIFVNMNIERAENEVKLLKLELI